MENVALTLESVAINSHCIGQRWSELDRLQLARLVALVAMGQASKAALIIKALEPAGAEFAVNELCDEAIITLSVQETASVIRKGYPRVQRDGFIFEAISWIAAKQGMGSNAVLKPPHTSSTTQGLDGLMLEVDRVSSSLREATIFEDKCTEDPRATFLSKVLPGFKDRHTNKRSAELVATASTLLAIAGFSPEKASAESARVLSIDIRKYRSAFAVNDAFDSKAKRSFLFGRYEEITGIKPEQRIGACLVVQGAVRDWFDEIAAQAVDYIESLKV